MNALTLSAPAVETELRIQRLEEALALAEDRYAGVYDLLKAFDVYGTGGDASSCAREILMQLSESRTATGNALRERDNSKAAHASALKRLAATVEKLSAAEQRHAALVERATEAKTLASPEGRLLAASLLIREVLAGETFTCRQCATEVEEPGGICRACADETFGPEARE